MSLDLGFDDDQLALQRSVDGYCTRAGTGPLFTVDDPLPEGFWQGLAGLGVLGLGTENGGGGVLDIAAAMEILGSHGAPGPLVGTFTATSLLDRDEVDALACADGLVSVGTGGLFPWMPLATHVVAVEPDGAWLVEPAGPVEDLATTGSEPWGRAEYTRVEALGDATEALARAEVAIAAYAVGAAQRLLDRAVDWARDRVQFNRAIATFQAVSHPLATASMNINASRILTRVAAQKLDTGAPDAAAAAATARLSTVNNATATAYQVHQVFGAMGFTREGPVGHLSHRIRQVGLLPPAQSRARSLVLEPLLSS